MIEGQKRTPASTYYHKNKEKMTAASKQWRKDNPERARELALIRKRRYREKHREALRKVNWRVRGAPDPTRPRPELCENCGGKTNGRGSLHLDHDHETGLFRGWLCSACNTGLGKLGDNEAGLHRALSYLARAKREGTK